MDTVVVGIPTFKRQESLTRLLNSIAVMTQPTGFIIKVIVADNEGEQGQGIARVKELASGFPFEIHTIGVTARGISSVRNALLEYAFDTLNASKLAMIDDDEVVEKEWLAELLRVQHKFNADVVGGAVLPEFESTPETWLAGLNIYYREIYKEGPIDIIQGTTNVLLSSSVWSGYNRALFDVKFGLSGGGDKEYFTRLKKQGCTFAFADKALAHEYFGTSRMTKCWAKQRAYRIGSGDSRIKKAHTSLFSQGIYLTKTCLILLIAVANYLLKSYSEDKKLKATLLLQRQLGKLQGLFSSKLLDVYSKTHGS